MIMDGLATGSIWLFLATMFISVFFQFFGFMFTYLLATTHAARDGSKAGLGITLIQLGFYSKTWSWTETSDEIDPATGMPINGTMSAPIPPSTTTTVDGTNGTTQDESVILPGFTPRDWIAFLLMTFGWFILLTNTLSFWRIKRWERSLSTASASDPAPSPEEIERDIATRRNIASVFGIQLDIGEDHYRAGQGQQNAPVTEEDRLAQQFAEARARAADERLTRDLRAAGLL
jgi:hypothetical protein